MRDLIFGNLWIKLFAVLLSCSLWFFVTYRGQSELSLDAPLEFKNVPQGLEILKQSAKSVSINVRGHERLIKDLRPLDVRVAVDMSKARQGEAVYYFDKDDVISPRSLRVLRLEPSSVKVSMDESVRKVLPVKASVTGIPEQGYRLVRTETQPQGVTVEGPKTEIARTAFLRTEAIDITGLDSGLTQEVRLNTGGRNLRIKTPEVSVKIVIERGKQ